MVTHPLPADLRSDYFHAHIYFTPETMDRAKALRDRLLASFDPSVLRVYRMFDHPIGPHPIGMFEADFRAPDYTRVVDFLADARGDLDVLVHQNTEDEVWNHSQGAVWLGRTLPIDFDSLRAFMAGRIPAVSATLRTDD